MKGTYWHDINEPGMACIGRKAPPPPKKEEMAVEEILAEHSAIAAIKASTVRLFNPQWIAGTEGFAFNRKCRVQVAAAGLAKDSGRRVTFSLFVESAAGKEPLQCSVDALVENGIAEAEVVLYYGEKYYNLFSADPSQKCTYTFTATHPDAASAVTSPSLVMPAVHRKTVDAGTAGAVVDTPAASAAAGTTTAAPASAGSTAAAPHTAKTNTPAAAAVGGVLGAIAGSGIVQKLLLGDIPGVMAYCPLSVASNAPAYVFIPSDELESFAKNALSVQADMKAKGEMLAQARGMADPPSRCAAIRTFCEQWSKRFLSAAQGTAVPTVQELIILNDSPALRTFKDCFVYVDTAVIQPNQLFAGEDALRSAIQAKVEGELKPLAHYVKDSVKKKLWKTPAPADGRQFGEWNFCAEAAAAAASSDEEGNAAAGLSATHEAACIRALSAACGNAAFDQGDMRSNIRSAGSITVSTRGCAASSFDLYYPGADGVDLFTIVKAIDASAVKQGRTCFIRLKISGTARGFLAAHYALSLPWNELALEDIASERVRDSKGETRLRVSGRAQAPLFGNAVQAAEFFCGGEWKDPLGGGWKSFVREGGTIAAADPAMPDKVFSLDFRDGTIVLTVKAGLITGLSGDVYLVYAMSIADAYGLLEHIFESTGHRRLAYITDRCRDAFLVYQYYHRLRDEAMLARMRAGDIPAVAAWWRCAADSTVKTIIAGMDASAIARTAPAVLARFLGACIGNHHPGDYETILSLLDRIKTAYAGEDPQVMQAAVVGFLGSDSPDDSSARTEASLRRGKNMLLDYFDHPLSRASGEQAARLEETLQAL